MMAVLGAVCFADHNKAKIMKKVLTKNVSRLTTDTLHFFNILPSGESMPRKFLAADKANATEKVYSWCKSTGITHLIVFTEYAYKAISHESAYNKHVGEIKDYVYKDWTVSTILLDDIEEAYNTDRNLVYKLSQGLEYFIKFYLGEAKDITIPLNFHFTKANLKQAESLISASEVVAIDLETEGLDPDNGNIKMVGWSGKYKDKYWSAVSYLPESPDALCDVLSKDSTSKLVASAKIIVMHNAAFDVTWLYKHGVLKDIPLVHDTMGMSYLINNLTSHSLKQQARYVCGVEPYEKKISHASGATGTKDMELYCRNDTYLTLVLYHTYMQELLSSEMKKLYLNIVAPVSRILRQIEKRGVQLDTTQHAKNMTDTVAKVSALDREIQALIAKHIPAYKGVNLNSPTQLVGLLYNPDGLAFKKVYNKSASLAIKYEGADPGEFNPVTGKATLQRLSATCRNADKKLILDTILEYRKYNKMLTGFLQPYETLKDENNKLHPQYKEFRTATGRLSAYSPNLQNVSRDDLVRNLISADKFIEADYSQIELRVAAILGKIHSMQRIYMSKGDIHTNTAIAITKLAGLDWRKLTDEEKKEARRRAKAVNFGFIYGMQAEGFRDYAFSGYGLLLDIHTAKEYRDLYFNLYPEIGTWHNNVIEKVKRKKLVTTLTGRTRYLPNVDSPVNYLRGGAYRAAINTPVQSFASDITLTAMLKLHEAGFKLIGQCHDAVFIEEPSPTEDTLNKIYTTMVETVPQYLYEMFGIDLTIPLDAEIKVGKCWGDPEAKVFEKKS